MLLGQIKKQASTFLQEKYKSARLVLTDVTQAELLAEEATNGNPCSPDARTMTRIAEASFGIDDFWRIVDVLHRRLENIDLKQWRQYYKTLVLVEFLLTHGPEDFAQEFQSDLDVIQELGRFEYIDQRGFNWGVKMQRISDEILKLLEGGQNLKQARLKALKITKEIQGFGNPIMLSPNSALSPPSSASSSSSRTTPFSAASFTWNDMNNNDPINKMQQLVLSPKDEAAVGRYPRGGIRDVDENNVEGKHLWTRPTIEEKGSLLEEEDDDDDDQAEKTGRLVGGKVYSKINDNTTTPGGHDDHVEKVGFRSISDVGKAMKKKFNRQLSLWN
ncbi:hypothetical protein FNV43_RR01414 [Rhamnella rubrinervis]|uniref:ENTH domain-containing protein n=1 Tax=Rhamnella rubrinervis TaxID=2594499 RepID=A0A8K0HQG1_9ROSA|nr:hypothetical protein FNV43_RR01414 [Rhamnella rubrinervis]